MVENLIEILTFRGENLIINLRKVVYYENQGT